MAVYTVVEPAALAALMDRFDLGPALSCKGIAEGVENSNYRIDTPAGPVILTLYERRIGAEDLPYFVALIDRLHGAGLPVPRMIADRSGTVVQTVAGRPACLIEFLHGLSPTTPDADACHAVGGALAALHAATRDHPARRPNPLGHAAWGPMAGALGPVDRIAPGLERDIADALAAVGAGWPTGWPTRPVHTDLFPDNVLMRDGRVTGLIDFYFAADDLPAYDYMVTHAAWCWDETGGFHADRAAALWDGYRAGGGALSDVERAALPLLGRGASLRFVLTRAAAWVGTPDHALVVRKHPDPFRRRMTAYARLTPDAVLGR